MQIIYAPTIVQYLYLSLKSKSLFFFTATNPAIDTGGLMGESKMDIMDEIPAEFRPVSILIPAHTPIEKIRKKLEQNGLKYPIIIKPNVGERGFLVEKAENEQQLIEFLGTGKIDTILQEFIDYTEEVSVLHYRIPGEKKGNVSSLTFKEFLTVTGDGTSTIKELIENYPRALLQLKKLKKSHAYLMDKILPNNEPLQLVAIGNHSRGTTFINGNNQIDQDLINVFDKISHQMNGIYFGRYDIKCKSLADLKKAKAFKILEINGVKAEPTHIYDPSYSLLQAWKDIYHQWNIIYKISQANKKNGVPFMSFQEGKQKLINYFKYKKFANTN